MTPSIPGNTGPAPGFLPVRRRRRSHRARSWGLAVSGGRVGAGSEQAEGHGGQAGDGVEHEVVGRGEHHEGGGRRVEPARCRHGPRVAVTTAAAHQAAQATCRLGMAA